MVMSVEVPHRIVSPAIGVAKKVQSRFLTSPEDQENRLIQVPADGMVDLVRELTGTVKSTVHQVIPFPPRESAAQSYSYSIWRNLSQQGVFVRRIYLVPPGEIEAESIERQMMGDRSCGIDVRCLPITSAFRYLPSEMPGNIWILDETTVVRESSRGGGDSTWTVSEQPEEVSRAYAVWDDLWAHATSQAHFPESEDMPDPLVLTADLFARMAPITCTHDYEESTSCSWYHGAWQYLRLFGMVSNPKWHDAFYRIQLVGALSHALKSTDRKVQLLLSGCADYALLAYILQAADRLGARDRVRIKVIDVCPTPLICCRWYAKEHNAEISVEELDILNAPQKMSRKLDIITCDAFLTRFPRSESEKLVAAWGKLLRPGGLLVTTIRVHPLDSSSIRNSEDEISDFVTRARSRAGRWLWCLDANLDALTSAARRYALRIRSTDVGDVSKIKDLLDANGFDILFDKLHRVPGEFRATSYLQVVAVKRP
jgi:hypothetical protein